MESIQVDNLLNYPPKDYPDQYAAVKNITRVPPYEFHHRHFGGNYLERKFLTEYFVIVPWTT